MTLRLVVHTEAWDAHVRHVVATVRDAHPPVDLVPVVKGNGYGFGRRELAERACRFADTIAVGTVHEVESVAEVAAASDTDIVVLTPASAPPPNPLPDRDVIMTVSTVEHVRALGAWQGRVIVKAASSVRRYGTEDVETMIETAQLAELEVVGVAVHPPLVGSEQARRAEVERWLARVDPVFPLWVSHLDLDHLGSLPDSHRYRLRLGTALWHGDKSMLHLDADVIETRRVRGGETAGYRLRELPGPGVIAMVGAGTAHGVHPLADGRSPFHFDHRRLDLVEPPHMHTSMLFLPDGVTVPAVGDRVDVQRPLTTTWVDVVDWR